jgi:hypothetical protein
MFRRPKAVERKSVERNLINKEGLETPSQGVLVADLTSALRKMDVRDWRGEHDEWFALMAACAYFGITCDDFVAWSISDPYYASDGALIRRKWRSLKPKHGGALMAALKARGIKVNRADGQQPFVPEPHQRYDPTEGMRMPPPALQAMVAAEPRGFMAGVLHDNRAPTGRPGMIPTQRTSGGSGGSAGDGTGWAREIPLGPSMHQRYVDAQLDAADKADRIELAKKIAAQNAALGKK